MRVLTIIPTYNEIESLPRTLDRLRAVAPATDVLVVDDNSPDGTGAAADTVAAADSAVHVLHRQGKEGLGAAYIAGFDATGRLDPLHPPNSFRRTQWPGSSSTSC